MKKAFFLTALLGTSAISLGALSTGAMARPMTETDLVMMKRLSAVAASPDGQMIAYQLRETDLAANKGKTDLYMLKLGTADAQPVMFASTPDKNEHDPAFSPDSKSIYYISNQSGSDQIWRYDIASATATQASDFKADVSGFKISPNGKNFAIWGDIARDCMEFGCDTDGDTSKPGPGTGRVYDQLMVRHWDQWETPGNYSRLFTVALGADGTLGTSAAAMDGTLVGDAPTKPFGGGEEISWSADSSAVLFTLRFSDAQEAKSTNLDIYRSALGKAKPVNMTADNAGMDTTPVASPDGKYLAWTSMARATYEADRLVVKLMDLKSGKVIALTEKWDRSVGSLAWAADSKSLLATAQDVLETPLFRIDLNGKVTRLTDRGNIAEAVPLKNGGVVYAINSIAGPSDLIHMDAKGRTTRLTNVNADTLAMLDPVNYQQFNFAGANGDQVYGQIVKPQGATGKLPVLLLVHGGPQGTFNNNWSYRWNPAVMAAQGYAVVSIDFHGSTGYGQKFTDSINKNWGGWPLEDLQKGMDAVGKIDTQLDTANACALGGSYGGYMMNWISGNWPDRFKCLVNHAGIFDLRAMAYETEELWFDQWDNGGPWTTRSDAEKWNPVNHVTKWKTPTLVIHGEKDYRIPYSQSLAAFTALQQQGVESKLLVFPDENHWVLKPKNSVQWHRTVFDWVGKYLKGK
ncbi:alpha/beta hydrolase family protein [Sphingorhabdus wooponensis]|uniref:S9 family peptidase n=1 Tax=Sphingorhabdus wooponensis TaxID=940136 RepID=A0A3R8Q765_9SPHN|nr:S9 family peptidase [Sphingorhabdus wooponensis]RRQ51169.1 S9 family peptidase [Sphingorhabdus wooponensis]